MTGTVCIDLTDTSRKEVLGKKEGFRKITIRFYYPAAEEKGSRSDCLSEKKRKWLGKEKDFGLYESRVALYEGARMKDGTFPLILFNHGYGGFVEQNNDLCQYLAEHGYIVASIGHSYEAIETVYADGSSVTFDNSLYFRMFKPFIPAVIDLLRLRKMDLDAQEGLKCFDVHQNRYERFIVERVAEWEKDDRIASDKIRAMNEDETSFLYRKIDFSNGIGMTGHSYGGALAYAHCLDDSEVSCGINLDGGLFGNFGEKVNHKPFLQILNPGNVNVVSRSRIYHDSPVHYMVFRDIEHNGFTDKKLVGRNKAEIGTCDPVQTLDTVNAAHVAFFDRYLKNAEAENREPLPIDLSMIEKYEIL